MYQKIEILSQIQKRNLGEIEVSGLGSVHKASYRFYYAPRGSDSSYLGLFSIFGLEMGACSIFLSGVLGLGELCFA